MRKSTSCSPRPLPLTTGDSVGALNTMNRKLVTILPWRETRRNLWNASELNNSRVCRRIPEVDFVIEIPVRIAQEVVGFRYDEAEGAFDVLRVSSGAKPRWKFW